MTWPKFAAPMLTVSERLAASEFLTRVTPHVEPEDLERIQDELAVPGTTIRGYLFGPSAGHVTAKVSDLCQVLVSREVPR